MPRIAPDGTRPDKSRLYEIASGQGGYFTNTQAAEAGYSLPLLQYHVNRSLFERAGRGVLRLAHFPPGDHDDLVAFWLWSDRKGVFSHETALMLHRLSDAMPATSFMTLPLSSQRRRLRPPTGLLLEFADIPKEARAWLGPIPLTEPLRTIEDCIALDVDDDLVRQAIGQSLRAGFFGRKVANRLYRHVRERYEDPALRKP